MTCILGLLILKYTNKDTTDDKNNFTFLWPNCKDNKDKKLWHVTE